METPIKCKTIKLLVKCDYRKRCFTSDYFKGCLDALQLTDELEKIKSYIKQVNGAQPPELKR